MDPSTSPASPDSRRFGLTTLERFYEWNAPLYDWTRPFILRGRKAVVEGLDVRPGHHVIDVGCGTGVSLPWLVARGARVTGVEPSPAMRRRAQARVSRLGAAEAVSLCALPFGADERHRLSADRVLFSYSLSMIPPFEEVVRAACESLRPGGRVGVVDFLDAAPGMRGFLRVSHVFLGPERLETLKRVFPEHRAIVRRTGAWRYYLFWGERAF